MNHIKPSIDQHRVPIHLSNTYTDPVDANSILSYSIPSLPNKRFQQLKNGQIPWEARLDLHGLKADSASDELQNFIANPLQIHTRCILIIHGKGGYSGEPPIIKNYINHWLKQIPDVLAFHSALPREGGTGALYVLLKKLFIRE